VKQTMTERAVRERPIIFAAPMVRALLADRKTQTRRIVKPQPDSRGTICAPFSPEEAYRNGFLLERWPRQEREFSNFGRCERMHCPRGVRGDRLWVRETWGVCNGLDDLKPSEIPYLMDVIYRASSVHPDESGMKWRPPIFMPRWASRITLEITDVRVQRLHEISEEDAEAEGCEAWSQTAEDIADAQIMDIAPQEKELARLLGPGTMPAKAAFRMLWDSINGPGLWDANPWVWALTFKRVDA
jgi:hypothetical protein